MADSVPNIESLDASSLKAMLAAASDWLDQNAEAVDAINVFPVPDGDTGSNMSATMRAAERAADEMGGGAGAVLSAAARGGLLGARGNSGVILSQILEGLASGAGDVTELDGAAFAAGLKRADSAARHAVTEPREGTILTVLSDAAEAAALSATEGSTVREVMEAGASAARASVARTPELLPILKEAGVVDSGGLGLSLILDGCLASLTGEIPSATPAISPIRDHAVTSRKQTLHGSDSRAPGTALGYCTEFMIQGETIDLDRLRDEFQRLGDSVLVVGQPPLVRIHLHANDPGPALSAGVSHGALSRIKIDNLDEQHRALASSLQTAPALPIVAVAVGDGFEALLRDYGAIVVHGGQTLNPSTQEILSAIDRAPAGAVFLLPNNRNVSSTAGQAARLAQREVLVIQTVSIPQGIAAVLSFNPAQPSGENVTAMERAATAVRTAEVTRAARDVSICGIHATHGQPIGLVDDKMVAAAASPEEAVAECARLIAGTGEAATLYYGAEIAADHAEDCGDLLRAQHPSLDVQVIRGGQPHYDYILSVE